LIKKQGQMKTALRKWDCTKWIKDDIIRLDTSKQIA